MKWITRGLVHFDRLISPWLIKRFIDADAEFIFLPEGQMYEHQDGVIPFGVPGVELSDHDERGPAFAKIKRKYELNDPVLDQLDDLVAQGVDYVVKATTPRGDRVGRLVVATVGFSEGLMVSSRGDQEAIEHALPLFDSLYTLLRAEHLLATDNEPRPDGISEAVWETVFMSALASHLRRTQSASALGEWPIGPEFREELAAVRGQLRAAIARYQ